MGKIENLDGNTAALNQHERAELENDRLQDLIEKEAIPVAAHYMANLDSDLIQKGFEALTLDDFKSLAEDFGTGPMADVAHGGLVIKMAIERAAFREAVEDVS